MFNILLYTVALINKKQVNEVKELKNRTKSWLSFNAHYTLGNSINRAINTLLTGQPIEAENDQWLTTLAKEQDYHSFCIQYKKNELFSSFDSGGWGKASTIPLILKNEIKTTKPFFGFVRDTTLENNGTIYDLTQNFISCFNLTRNNTIFIFSGLVGKETNRRFITESSLHIPLMVKVPKKRGAQFNNLTSHFDTYHFIRSILQGNQGNVGTVILGS